MRQEATNKRLAVVLVVLLATIVCVWVAGGQRKGVDPDIFKVNESVKIDSVVMTQGGEVRTLHFNDIRWMLNDSLEADRQMVTVLFATLNQVEAKRPLAETLRDSVATLLKSVGTHVQCFVQGERVADFWAGGNAAQTQSWFLKTGDEFPYVVAIPGYRVYASGIMEQPSLQWRNKRVFNFNWRNFKELATHFPREAEHGFTITMGEKYFGVPGLADIDTTKLNDYLDQLSLLEAERFYVPGETRLFDSLLVVPPSFTVRVQDISQRTYTLTIYPPLRQNNQVVGRIGQQPVIFQKQQIVPVARKKSFFGRTVAPD